MNDRFVLPRLVVLVLRRVVPARRADAVIADLEDEYAARRETLPRAAAIWWLLRETLSLVGCYLAAPFDSLRFTGPVWFRDLVLVCRGLRRRLLAGLGAAAMLSTGLLAVLLTAGLSRSLLFRPVSEAHGDALRRVSVVDRQGRTILRLSHLELQTLREQLGDSAMLTSVNLQPVVVRANAATLQTMAEVVDGNYFALTGMTTVIGRGILSTDDRPEAARVAVIAQPFWRDRFGSSPGALGQDIVLNGTSYTIVGVAKALGSSSFLGASVDAWVPLAHADPILNRGWRVNVADRWFMSYVLPAGSIAEVETRLAAAAGALAQHHPDPWRERRLQTAPGTALTGAQRRSVTMLVVILAAFALLILTVTGANVAGLLLARAAADRRHAAIHLSLGSGRGAVARRLVIEGSILGLVGGCLAIALYAWARTWFTEIALLPTLALRLSLPLDVRIAALTAAAGLVTGIALAIAPAAWASRLDLADALRDAGQRADAGRAIARTRRVLVAAQVSLSLALVFGAALFTRSLDALVNVDVGFNRSRLLAMDFDLEPSGPALSELPVLAREALERVSAIPGITGAAMSNRAPIDQSTPTIEVRATGADAAILSDVSMYLATPGYFDTIGLPLTAGRTFTRAEADAAADVVIVNEDLAGRLWPPGDALERTLTLVAEQKAVRVVGVARNSKYRALSESSRPHLYRPTRPRLGLTLLARTSGDPYEALHAMQRTLDEVGPGLVGFFPRTLLDHVEVELLPTRAAAAAASGLSTLALLLSAVGLYALVMWFVELRRREIGVRMALGASAREVRSLVVRQALHAALPGIMAGLLLAAGLGTIARSALFGVAPIDPLSFAAAIVASGLLVAVASYLPSRQATRVDPAIALRQ